MYVCTLLTKSTVFLCVGDVVGQGGKWSLSVRQICVVHVSDTRNTLQIIPTSLQASNKVVPRVMSSASRCNQ
jgi:hypothetical protein